MPYLIDGHNLIPNVPNLSLGGPDVEHQLIRMLQGFCRQRNQRVEVYFDQASPGQASRRSFGRVSAVFIRRGNTADAAIKRRLQKLGKQAPNWIIVSSDRAVRSAASTARARVMTAADFAAQLFSLPGIDETMGDTPSDPAEIDEWLRLFGQSPGDEDDDPGKP